MLSSALVAADAVDCGSGGGGLVVKAAARGKDSTGDRGVDPYGTGGTRPPNICTGGTLSRMSPSICLE